MSVKPSHVLTASALFLLAVDVFARARARACVCGCVRVCVMYSECALA